MKLLIAICILVLDVAFAVIEGFLLSILWKWFIVPVFHILPLSVPQAIGLLLTVTLITNQRIPIEETLGDLIDRVVAYKIVLWSSVLVISSAVHFFFL